MRWKLLQQLQRKRQRRKDGMNHRRGGKLLKG
ncbi:Protein of unknown function [Bacillus mycoides]|nr:Protein of unknown function [Bacillus mycoides]